MKTMIDVTCPRCGGATSTHGLSAESVRDIAALHVCPDGVAFGQCTVSERVVAGPGERTKLPEEQGR